MIFMRFKFFNLHCRQFLASSLVPSGKIIYESTFKVDCSKLAVKFPGNLLNADGK